jgi:hypothetical protein
MPVHPETFSFHPLSMPAPAISHGGNGQVKSRGRRMSGLLGQGEPPPSEGVEIGQSMLYSRRPEAGAVPSDDEGSKRVGQPLLSS